MPGTALFLAFKGARSYIHNVINRRFCNDKNLYRHIKTIFMKSCSAYHLNEEIDTLEIISGSSDRSIFLSITFLFSYIYLFLSDIFIECFYYRDNLRYRYKYLSRDYVRSK